MLLCTLAPSLKASEQKKTLENPQYISGNDLKLIILAITEFEKKGLQLSKYQIKLFQDNETTTTVIFEAPKRPIEQLGSSPNLKELEVEINTKTMTVTKVSFVR